MHANSPTAWHTHTRYLLRTLSLMSFHFRPLTPLRAPNMISHTSRALELALCGFEIKQTSLSTQSAVTVVIGNPN
ncbi:hypothetical protein I3760_13G071000 [Carya illinoinensis]|nr:hypothetical protein I3760_13G071000 [Carya illinoinensis]